MAKAVALYSDAARGEAPQRLNDEFGLTAMGASAARKVRLNVQGQDSVAVRIKGAVTGTVTLKLHPILADGTEDDAVGARATTGGPTDVALTTNTEAIIEYTIKGERHVEIEVTTAAASDFTVTYLDAFVRP